MCPFRQLAATGRSDQSADRSAHSKLGHYQEKRREKRRRQKGWSEKETGEEIENDGW